jgi:hypothetical protein
LPVGTLFNVKLSPGPTVAEMPVPTTVTVTVGLVELVARADATLFVALLNVPTIVAPVVPLAGEDGAEIDPDEPQLIDKPTIKAKATPAAHR